MAIHWTNRGKKIFSIVGGISIAVIVVGVTAGCLAAEAKKMPFEQGYNVQLTPSQNGATQSSDLQLSFRYDNQGPQWSMTKQSLKENVNRTVDLKLIVTWIHGNTKDFPSGDVLIKNGSFDDEDTENFGEFIQCKFNLLNLIPGLQGATGSQEIRLACWDIHNKCWIILGAHNFCFFFNYNPTAK